MLTKSEEQIMELLWTQSEPLTSSEIVKLSVDKTWKDSYVHLLINSLISKELLEVAGFKKATKNYARTFKPKMSREEYLVFSMTHNKNFDKAELSVIIKSFISTSSDLELLEELGKVIEARKSELK